MPRKRSFQFIPLAPARRRLGSEGSDVEFQSLMDWAESHVRQFSYITHPLPFALLLAANTGARISEISSLRWDDWRPGFRELTFRRSAWNRPGLKGRRIRGQTPFFRTVKVSAELAGHASYLEDAATSIWVFPGGKKHISAEYLSRILAEHCRREGYRITIHGIRRRWARAVYAQTGDLALAQLAMGHHSIYVTKLYAEPSIPNVDITFPGTPK